ncbi:MAG: ubiquitin-specific protease doa4 [Icmadophila ericetorum]|nr:ubiquitin-specific protease doa4 [Icmadophila ericetorum]
MASTSPRRGASGGPNGYAYSNGLTTSNRASWAESQGNPASVMDGHVIPPRYPHIKDLQAKAQADESVSINSSDKAYVEWLIGSNIVSEVIPRHREYPSMNQERGEQLLAYRALIRSIQAQWSMFQQITDMIKEDNSRSRIWPSSPQQALSSTPLNDRVQTLKAHPNPRPVSMPDTKDFMPPPLRQSAGSLSAEHSAETYRQRPPIHPKPNGLHSSKIQGSGIVSSSGDVVAERFAQLRIPNSGGNSASTGRPSGPREMPPPPLNGPSIPPKIPIDSHLTTSFPKAPSPTYSPARDDQSPYGIAPPRSTARSSKFNGDTVPMPTTSSNGADFPPKSSVDPITRSTKVSYPELNPSTAITAADLYDRLRVQNILLIDVRNREDFDEGHIFAKSIICIEPLSIRWGLSADELGERLVVSPENEQTLYLRKNEFDLIVYYDQNTPNDHFLSGSLGTSSAPALRALYYTLYEFNDYDQLQRPPAFLRGGLDAWVDIVGPQALQRSSTAAFQGITRPRQPVHGVTRLRSRAPTVSSSSLEVRRRRIRDTKPLDADEERAWLQKVKEEEVPDYQPSHSDGDTDSMTSSPEEPPSPLIHTYEDFLRKFPEPSQIQQSMIGYNSGPPSRPAPTPAIPQIPSRPPPAVPRPSYSGVSDRESSGLSPTSRQVSSNHPPLYVTKSPLYRKLPRTGLVNFSQTCYMNATIQCLNATIPLSQFFLDNKWKDFVQKNWKGSNGVMPGVYANLIRNLWKDDIPAIAPSSLRNFCARLRPEWGLDRQQDASEFLVFLLDILHEDLNSRWQGTPLNQLTPEQEMYRESLPKYQASKVEWDRWSHREKSFISSLFAGQHASILTCRTCRSRSTTYDTFFQLSVEIRRPGQSNIYDCLDDFCGEELLSGEEKWKCPHCKVEREAIKQIRITRIPQVLVINFKRFTGNSQKIRTPIDFPLYGLDMRKYMEDTQDRDAKLIDHAITSPFLYDAYAITRHLGSTMTAGHYKAYVKDVFRGCWREFNDRTVTDFDPNQLSHQNRLQNEDAYLVFYGRATAR